MTNDEIKELVRQTVVAVGRNDADAAEQRERMATDIGKLEKRIVNDLGRLERSVESILARLLGNGREGLTTMVVRLEDNQQRIEQQQKMLLDKVNSRWSGAWRVASGVVIAVVAAALTKFWN